VGYLVNHHYLGDKIRKITQPLIKKTPILNTLFRISKQAGDTLTNKKSFKEVVLVEFPVPGVYSVGFITGTTSKVFEDALCNETVTVFIPTTPNPTNGFLIVLEKNKVKKMPIEPKDATEFIISMGTVEINSKSNLAL